MAPPAGGTAQKKSQRPVLSSTLAHAHAFAPIPTPGGSSTSNSYFPLPTPPPPLRSFTLPQNGDQDGGATIPSTSYQTSASSRRPIDEGTSQNKKSTGSDYKKLESPLPKAPKHRQSKSSASGGQHFEFASAAPFSAVGSPRVSSASSVSGRSVLSIAEIDCFFVHGSRSSVYSAQSHSSTRSQDPSESEGSSAPLSELALTSEELNNSDNNWTSDDAERERQRAERREFMKARQALREETRRSRKRATGVELSPHSAVTWRDAVHARAQAQAALTLKCKPESWELRREVAVGPISQRAGPAALDAVFPAALSTLADTTGQQPLSPSGPGPPVNAALSTDTLTADLSRLTLSGSAEPLPSGESPPPLNRFDSDGTEVGSPRPAQA